MRTPVPVLTALGEVDWDLLRRVVTRGGRVVELLPTKWRLLDCMMRHPREVLTPTMLLEKVWDFSFDPTNATAAALALVLGGRAVAKRRRQKR